MDGRATIVVRAGDERTSLENAWAEPPFSVRRSGGRVLVGASAAGPLGGDRLALDVMVRPGAVACIGSVGAMSIHPAPGATIPSSLTSRCEVGEGGHLDWWPEPVVSIVGSDHVSTTRVALDGSATCCVVEEASLGRRDEPSGRLRLELHVERDGAPVVRHAETFGPPPLVHGGGSLVSSGDARHVLSAVVVGVDPGGSRAVVTDECRAAWLPVGDDAAVVLAVGSDRPAVHMAVASVAPELLSTGRRAGTYPRPVGQASAEPGEAVPSPAAAISRD